VVAPPALDLHLSLAQRAKDLTRGQFVAQLAVEAFVVAVLPRSGGLDEQSK
jgi:hypothetical protein